MSTNKTSVSITWRLRSHPLALPKIAYSIGGEVGFFEYVESHATWSADALACLKSYSFNNETLRQNVLSIVGSLCPDEGEAPAFAQLYIHDSHVAPCQ